MSKELIRLVGCTMAFDDEIVLNDINLYINDKEFLTLLGPSGCGKTTTLRIIAGFLQPTSGDVLFDGVRINDVPPHKRKVNTVFQRYALFPHLDVYENVAFGLRIAKLPEKEIDERVTEMLEIVSLKVLRAARSPNSPAVSSSVLPLPGLSSTAPRYCFLTSRWARWT
jgi:spermidine/putrescine transport system ATP-binding protein